MRNRSLSTIIATTVVMAASLLLAPSAAAAKPAPKPQRPEVISLPHGFMPEGISISGDQFFVGSRANGALYRGSLRTGQGAELVPGQDGLVAVGTEVDDRGQLWVAGGPTGGGRVYDSRTGEQLASYQFTSPPTFVNDVVVTDRAAYFTDSQNAVLYVVPLGRHGRAPADPGTPLVLTGDLVPTPGFNLNGIETTPDRRALIVVQSSTGLLFRVDPKTGATTTIDVDGVTVPNGDGLLRLGRTLYVVQNQLNQIRPIKLTRDGRSGTPQELITNPAFDVPATIGYWKGALYAVNARFTTPPTPDTPYTVVRTELS